MVDSSIWIDAFNGVNSRQVKELSIILGKENIFVGILFLVRCCRVFMMMKILTI
jgi:hypothetical protein